MIELEISMKPKEIESYKALFDKIIEAISVARMKSYRTLTKYQLSLNFEIGRLIIESQKKHGWGKQIVEDLSKDINRVIDGVKYGNRKKKISQILFFDELKNSQF